MRAVERKVKGLNRQELLKLAKELGIIGRNSMTAEALRNKILHQDFKAIRQHLKITWWDKHHMHVYGIATLVSLTISIFAFPYFWRSLSGTESHDNPDQTHVVEPLPIDVEPSPIDVEPPILNPSQSNKNEGNRDLEESASEIESSIIEPDTKQPSMFIPVRFKKTSDLEMKDIGILVNNTPVQLNEIPDGENQYFKARLPVIDPEVPLSITYMLNNETCDFEPDFEDHDRVLTFPCTSSSK